MRFQKLLGAFIVITAVGILYDKYKDKYDPGEDNIQFNLVQKHLLNGEGSDKPIMWIHTEHNTNARYWSSFYSRNSNKLNQPYINMCIETIVKWSGDSFNICLINDSTFDIILPNWNIDLSRVSASIKMNLRHLAISTILSIYGGMFIPSSFICFKSLNSIYEKYTSNNDMFIAEFPNKTGTNSSNKLLASTEVMGCKVNSVNMNNYIKHLELLFSNDFGMEAEFLGKNNIWLTNEINSNNINLIQARYFGICDVDGDVIEISDLISSNKNIKLDQNCVGVYIPWNELINRTQFQWFTQLSPADVLHSNTNISKYLLLCEV